MLSSNSLDSAIKKEERWELLSASFLRQTLLNDNFSDFASSDESDEE